MPARGAATAASARAVPAAVPVDLTGAVVRYADPMVPPMSAQQCVALVLHPNPSVQQLMGPALAAAGITSVLAASGAAAVAALAAGTVDVVLVGLDQACDGQTGPPAGREFPGPHPPAPDFGLVARLREADRSAGTPIIGLSAAEDLDMAAGFAAGITDYAMAPFAGSAFVYRVRTVLARFAQQQSARRRADRLREEVRALSATIRSTHEPQKMALELVAGLGRTFGADRVWLHVFEDARVPRLTAEWNRPGLPGVQLPWEGPGGPTQALADRLWKSTGMLMVPDHDGSPVLPGGGELPDGLQAPYVRAWVAVPLGEGKAAFGMVLLLMTEAPRTWDGVELSLIQHVCGNLAHELVQGHLITAQQQVLTRLMELDKAKNDFVATVNHELRTPLTSISGYVDMIREGAGGPVPPAMDPMLAIVERNSDRLRHLIEDMLTISRIDSPSGKLLIGRVAVGGLLRRVVADLAPMAAAKGITVTCSLPPEDLLVEGDAEALERVFTNITSNAVKFTPAAGRVDISACRRLTGQGPAHIDVTVRDTGIGIPAADLPKLFGRFFRASNATAAAVPGTGLGLAIVQSTVNQHGGDVSVDSELGAGTTVTVSLPARTGS